MVLKLCHHENPAAKTNDKLCRWLGRREEPLNRTEFYGLLVGSMEPPSLSAKASRTMQEALLTFTAKTKASEANEDYWPATKDTFDMILLNSGRKALSDGVSRSFFPGTPTLVEPLHQHDQCHRDREGHLREEGPG